MSDNVWKSDIETLASIEVPANPDDDPDTSTIECDDSVDDSKQVSRIEETSFEDRSLDIGYGDIPNGVDVRAGGLSSLARAANLTGPGSNRPVEGP